MNADIKPISPIAEVISLGDELISGQRLDTNSQWLSQQLTDIGVRPRFHTTVGDDIDAMQEAIKIACKRANIVITTGGLGPTADDLTRQVIADHAGVPLVMDERMAQHIENLFNSRGRQMPEANRVQAMYPKGGHLIPNGTGTAPGVDFFFQQGEHICRLMALPGVPSELKPMWREYLRPAIIEQWPQLGTILHHAIHCFGLAESDVEKKAPELIQRGRIPTVGITATKATITLRIAAAGASVSDCQSLIEPTARLIRETFGEFIFGENEITLQEVLVQLLSEKDAQIFVIDLGGCSLIAEWLTEADQNSSTYLGTLSLKKAPDETRLNALIDQTNQKYGNPHILVIGPAFQQENLLKREITLIKDERVISQTFNAASNPAIVAQRSVKQALNFVRLAIQQGQI